MGRKRVTKKTNPNIQQQQEDVGIVTCKTSNIYGRYLEANKNISKGTLILSEKFLLAGPLRSSGPVCLGCHAEINIKNPKIFRCSRCSWPVCSEKCIESIFHVSECKFFVEKNIKFPTIEKFDFGLITVLRGLLLKINNPSDWEKLLQLEHHNELRKFLPLWKENQENIVNFIGNQMNLGTLFSEECIHTVCGILEVNSFEMGETFSFRGIFPNSAMVAHDCIPNATQFENSIDGIIEIRAAIDIPLGSPILLSYAFCLQSTPLRQKMLLDTKFFNCMCRRCSDPTEIGSHTNTLICQMCKIGYIISNSISKDDEFKCCNQCQNRMKTDEIEHITFKFAIISQELHEIESQEKFLKDCQPIFHSGHFIPFGIKFNLCQSYGRQDVSLFDLSQKDLERKSEICYEVLQKLNIILPGFNITRGLVLYEYQAAQLTLARRIYETKKFSKKLLRRKLENILEILIESITILEYSHPSTDEYKMARAAKEDSLPGLHKWIFSLK